MNQTVEADDEVRRFHAVYLGPPDMTLPWQARYSAYAVFASSLSIVCVVEGLAPGVSVGIPPVMEIVLAFLGTTLVMTAVDHDRPLGAVAASAAAAVQTRHTDRRAVVRRRRPVGQVKITRGTVAEVSEPVTEAAA